MPDVLKPQAFHERFTLYLNAAGEAVERTFAEMTAPEVLAAIKWHASEGNRLEREAAPFAEIAEIVEAGGNLPVETSRQTIERAIVALRQAGEAQGKAARLMVLVRTNIPQWHRHPGLSLDAALRRFWPGGRAGSVIKEVMTMHPSRKKNAAASCLHRRPSVRNHHARPPENQRDDRRWQAEERQGRRPAAGLRFQRRGAAAG
jgi:hypothetical protein